jgi:hypothetical protein
MKKRITESFVPEQSRFLSDNDSHHWLMTAMLPGKVDIVNLKETNPQHSSYYYVDDPSVKLEQTDPNVVCRRQTTNLTCIGQHDPIRQIIKHRQPYMYDQAEIINYYDHPFYRDWRYPERPIDPKFAANPQRYCELNPHVYPCYKYYSKW